MRKGQIEIIGLVIVVIILVLGALFYVWLAGKEKPNTANEVVLETSYASNLLSAVLNVKICNETKQVKEAIVSCFNEEELCDKDACNLVSEEVNKIISEITVKDFRKYTFKAKRDGEGKKFKEECKTGTNIMTKITGNSDENYEINLQIC